jgi:hypothetical protein
MSFTQERTIVPLEPVVVSNELLVRLQDGKCCAVEYKGSAVALTAHGVYEL